MRPRDEYRPFSIANFGPDKRYAHSPTLDGKAHAGSSPCTSSCMFADADRELRAEPYWASADQSSRRIKCLNCLRFGPLHAPLDSAYPALPRLAQSDR